jgi:hypothetical protein
MGKSHASQSDGSGPSSLFSRRRLLGLSGAVGLAAMGATLTGCGQSQGGPGPASANESAAEPTRVTAPPANGVLGANFNGDPRSMNFAELQNVSATWLRGFIPTSDVDQDAPENQPPIQTLLTASGSGYGTVLSLKFPYFNQPIPTPGSPAMATELGRLDKVLPVVMNKVDILGIGNEPFIETQRKDWDRINAFYETLAQHVIDYRDKHFGTTCKTQLYMGALNHLDQPDWRTPATERWMTFVRNTPSIAGTDIHPHLPEPGADQAYLDYVLPRMRADQKFLATEFSLVLFWQKHLNDPVSTEFAARYGVQRGVPVWQVIKDAIDHPFPQQKWDDFLAMTPWFEGNKNYLQDQVQKFRKTGRLAVATYGVGQDAAMVDKFGPKSTPWLLNSLFCPHTVQPGRDGLPGRNTTWVDEFRALQHN